jgi:hypothetical protein
MDDLFLMGSGETRRHLFRDVNRLPQFHRTAFDLGPECLPLVAGHHDEHPALGRLIDLVNRTDIRVFEGRSRLRFMDESFPRLSVADQGGKELQSNCALEPGVLCFVDHTHTPLPEFFENVVVGNGLTDHSTLQQVSNVAGNTIGADLGSGFIINECHTVVQNQLLEHPSDADVSKSRARL